MTGDKDVKESVLLTDTYAEIEYIFSSESDFSENDKRNLFKFNYKDNMVQWTGALLACKYIENGVYSVSMDHTGDDFGDVIFNTFTNCTTIPLGSSVKYKITLIDWKTTIFIGKEGELIEWD